MFNFEAAKLPPLLIFIIMDLFSGLSNLNAVTGQMAASALSASIAAAKNKELQKLVYQQQVGMSREAYDQNINLMNLQRAWNKEDYDKVLKDTSPSAAVQRYKAAGLSDAAAAQAAGDISPQVNQNTALSAPQPSAPSIESPWNGFSIDILGALRQVMALRKDKVEAETLEQTQESDINGILTTNEAKSWALKEVQERLRFAIQTNPYSARSIMYKSHADSHLEESIRLANDAAANNLKLAQQKYDFLEKMHTYEFKQAEQEINNLVASYDKIQQDIETSKSQEGYYEGLQNLTKEQIETQKEETKNKSIANLADGIDAVLKKYGSPSNNAEKIGALVREGILQPNQVVSYLQNARDYVLTGQDVFSGDTDLRNVFINEINPGIGENRKQPLWNIGTFDNLWNRVKQPYKGLRDSFRRDHSNGNRYHNGF